MVPEARRLIVYSLQITQSTLNSLAHIFIGIVFGVQILWAIQQGLPMDPTQLHVVLCAFGYNLLMAQAILSLSSENGWSWRLKLIDKRRAHWIIMLVGSGLGMAGCIVKFLDKEVHWRSLHGQFALVSFVFTIASFVNGLAALYNVELKFIPGNFMKVTHILFGIVAFGASSIALIYGFDKHGFKNFVTEGFMKSLVWFTIFFTLIILISPCITFYKKTFRRTSVIPHTQFEDAAAGQSTV